MLTFIYVNTTSTLKDYPVDFIVNFKITLNNWILNQIIVNFEYI